MSNRKQSDKDYFWSGRMGLGEWTTEDQLEVAARTAAVLAEKLKEPETISGYQTQRHSIAITRCMGNGAHRRGFGVSRD